MTGTGTGALKSGLRGGCGRWCPTGVNGDAQGRGALGGGDGRGEFGLGAKAGGGGGRGGGSDGCDGGGAGRRWVERAEGGAGRRWVERAEGAAGRRWVERAECGAGRRRVERAEGGLCDIVVVVVVVGACVWRGAEQGWVGRGVCGKQVDRASRTATEIPALPVPAHAPALPSPPPLSACACASLSRPGPAHPIRAPSGRTSRARNKLASRCSSPRCVH
eukprot:298307-Chlamydomonas_euryale.AAC.1